MPDLTIRQVYEQLDPADKTRTRRRTGVAFMVGAFGPFERFYDSATFNLETAQREIAAEFGKKGFGQVTVSKTR